MSTEATVKQSERSYWAASTNVASSRLAASEVNKEPARRRRQPTLYCKWTFFGIVSTLNLLLIEGNKFTLRSLNAVSPQPMITGCAYQPATTIEA